MQPRIRLFSKRHERAIYDRRLSVSLPRRLRRRLWHILGQYNERFEVVDHTNWHSTSSTLEELESELKGRYGVETLEGLNAQDERGPVDLQGFVLGAYPSQVFDVIELFYVRLSESQRLDFQGSMNLALDEEGSNWRLADGQFFQVSSDFLAVQVVARSYELLKAEGFEGALDEFNEARNDLESGDYKGAILNSCKSFESVVKSILGEAAGNASVLNRQLMGGSFGVGLPDGFALSFAEQVLNSLAFLRNRLGGHGQGEARVEVPKLYGQLAVHLAGAFILFAVSRYTELEQEKAPPPPAQPPNDDEEIPF